MTARFERPPTRPGFDPSRAVERALDPRGWRFDEAQRQAVYDVIAERRDVRRFRPDAVDDESLNRVLAAAHRAPSVGLMQPWRLIVIRSPETRSEIRRLAQRERLRQADRFDQRARQFLDQKIEGIVEAPLGICVCCDHGDPGEEVLGRGTIPETDVYSTACAIQNLWLAARAEGLGVGWVSFYRPDDLRAVLDLPARVDPIAYLCIGWPDERPVRPGLEAAGWSARVPLEQVVMNERWDERPDQRSGQRSDQRSDQRGHGRAGPSEPLNRGAATDARDRFDRLIKPAGGLGALEPMIERWAQIAGSPPPERIRAGVLVCAADHGHTTRGTSLFDSSVSAEILAAAARGESAVAVLAAAHGHRLLLADVGLVAPTPAGVRDLKIARGTQDIATADAMSAIELERALAAGASLVEELGDVDCVVLGEIGIGNTTTAAALACALAGLEPEQAVGRGTGVDAAGLDRKRATVRQALAHHGSGLTGFEALRKLGGFELAALTGAILAAAGRGIPVILDGFATGVAALAATLLDPLAGEALIAGHRSAEPGHELVLTELGLEPLLDLRLRLGEASGALLALPLLEATATLHRRGGTFAERGDADRGQAERGDAERGDADRA
jgi:nicotinate-nucleotide--dimethylbenzimidazole phosphoribosyltransferase